MSLLDKTEPEVVVWNDVVIQTAISEGREENLGYLHHSNNVSPVAFARANRETFCLLGMTGGRGTYLVLWNSILVMLDGLNTFMEI